MESEKREERLLQGWILYLTRTNERIFIPFVCHRCGKCCREVPVSPRSINPFKVAKYFGTSVEEVISKYFGEIVSVSKDGIQIRLTKPWKPCPFLKGNECSIYPIRPYPCICFPVKTDFGDCEIGCPGKLEAMRAMKRLRRGLPYVVASYQNFSLSGVRDSLDVRVSPKRWPTILRQYLESNPSKEALEIFLAINVPT